MTDVAGSQTALLSQVTVDSSVLQRFLVSEKQARILPFAGNLKQVSDLYVDAAEVLHRGKANEKVDQVKSDLIAVMKMEAEAHSLASTMDTLARQYAAGLQTTNFDDQVSQHMTTTLASNRFDPATNRKYLDLCKVLNAEEGADMDEDEDVMLEDGQNIELNTTCPMTMKSIYELESPVEDEKGVVYEEQQILVYLRERSGRASCPVAGMSHEITISSLRKSRRILREQKRRSERRNQGAAGEEADDDGVDVE